jgi:hypothetical protein
MEGFPALFCFYPLDLPLSQSQSQHSPPLVLLRHSVSARGLLVLSSVVDAGYYCTHACYYYERITRGRFV